MLPLFTLLRLMAEPTPFLFPFIPRPKISSFWGTSIAMTSSGTQETLSILVGRKYLIGSSLLTFYHLVILTYPLSSIAPPLTFPLLPPLSPFLAHGRCFRTWVQITYQFLYLSLSPWSFTPTSVPHPSTFRKLAGMALPPALTPTVLLQRNTFLFPLVLLSLPLWH